MRDEVERALRRTAGPRVNRGVSTWMSGRPETGRVWMRGPAMSTMLGASTRCCRPASRLHEICFTLSGGSSSVLVTTTVSAPRRHDRALDVVDVAHDRDVGARRSSRRPGRSARTRRRRGSRRPVSAAVHGRSGRRTAPSPTSSTRAEYSPIERFATSHCAPEPAFEQQDRDAERQADEEDSRERRRPAGGRRGSR